MERRAAHFRVGRTAAGRCGKLRTVNAAPSIAPDCVGERIDRATRLLLLALAASLPLSIAAAQVFAYPAVALWVVRCARRRFAGWWRHPFARPVTMFALAAVAASAFGVRPSHALLKCHRLLLFGLIFAAAGAGGADVAARRTFAARLVLAFAAGTSALAVYDLVRIPIGLQAGRSLIDLGNMRDPQFFMTALLLLLPGAAALPAAVRRWRWAGLLLAAGGLVWHFKRGAWAAFAVGATVLAAGTRRWRILLAVGAAALALLALPPTRERLSQLREEWMLASGGRATMWLRIAPGIIPDHPWGMGLGAVRNEDLVRYGPTADAKHNHLHNNALQIALELGFPGLAIWLGWMAVAIAVWVRAARAAARANDPARRALAVGGLSAFCALLADGMVEYNFGDNEILMLFSLLMGLAALLARSDAPAGAGAGAAP